MTTYNLFPGWAGGVGTANDDGQVTLGTDFSLSAPAWLTQIRWFRATDEATGTTRQGILYDSNGTVLYGPVPIPTGALNAWSAYTLPTALRLPAGLYKVCVFHPAARYTASAHWFDTGPNASNTVEGPVTIISNSASRNGQGTYAYGATPSYPTNSFNAAAYFSDATISDVDPAAAAGPTVTYRRYDGAAWTQGNAHSRAWDGAAWVPAQGKRWDGAAWQNLPA